MTKETILYDSGPSMFRNSPFWFITYTIMPIICWIALFISMPEGGQTGTIVIGAIISIIFWGGLFFWWVRAINIKFTVSNERITFRTGILSKNIKEVFLSDIRSVEIEKTVMQRIMGISRVEISSAASSEAEIIVDGIPNAYKIKTIIDEHRRKNK